MAKMRDNKIEVLYIDAGDKQNWAGCCRSRSGRMIFMGWISKRCCAKENLTPFPEDWTDNEPWKSWTPEKPIKGLNGRIYPKQIMIDAMKKGYQEVGNIRTGGIDK